MTLRKRVELILKWLWGPAPSPYFRTQDERDLAMRDYREAYLDMGGTVVIHPDDICDADLHAFVMARRHRDCVPMIQEVVAIAPKRKVARKKAAKKTAKKEAVRKRKSR